MLIYLMSAERSFKIVSVTGAHSSVGKTTLCSLLLKNLKGFGAIKFTKTSLYASIVDDINKLSEKGKDTALFIGSGAERVLWIKSPRHELKDLLSIAISRMADLKGVVIEGNSPVDFLNPHLIIFIVEPDGEIKPSAVEISKKSDIIVINSKKRVRNESLTKKPSFISTIRHKGVRVFWIDLAGGKGGINEFVRYVKERINKVTH